MKDVLASCQLLSGLDDEQIARVEQLVDRRRLAAGERLFELGAQADHAFVVLEGTVELCMPVSIQEVVREIAIASSGPGTTLGWSAFVKPYRFRLAARAAEPVTLAAFERIALLRLIGDDPALGCVILSRVAEIIGQRLLTVQALWARALQSTIAGGLPMPPPR